MKKWNKPQIFTLDVVATEDMHMMKKKWKKRPRYS